MEGPVKGDIVVVPFPFSDLSDAKRRLALVVACPRGPDVILCQITSRDVRDGYAIPLADTDFVQGGLRRESNVRPNRIFTAESSIILYTAGKLSSSKLQGVIDAVTRIIQD